MEVLRSNYKYKFEKINSKEHFEQITTKLLEVVKDYVKEKEKNNIDDDFNEYNYNKNKFAMLTKKIEKKECNIFVYYIEYNSKVIAEVFFIFDKKNINELLQVSTQENNVDNAVELICFYINKDHRGIGSKWLKDRVFPHLKLHDVNSIYVKSSHHKAFSFYEKLGTKIGTYTLNSDNKKYKSLGNMYQINI